LCPLTAQTTFTASDSDQTAGGDSQAPPPLTCPAGAPLGTVELSVRSPQNTDALPFQNINHLSEGDTLLYKPVLRLHEKRPGEIALVMVPAKRDPTREPLIVTDPKSADQAQSWKIPETISLAAFVYGPQGLSKKKVKGFLSQDDLLIAQLADYAEKTAQTEALIETLENSGSSSASVNAALTGFASQYGLAVQFDKNAPPGVQAQALFATMNPQLATYDPLTSSTAQRVGQTASVATAAAALFFGSPIGLAAGGTAMLLDLRAIAFPGTQFRSSFAQSVSASRSGAYPDARNAAALALCGQRAPAPPHTRVAYIWASRIPNTPVPSIRIGTASFVPVREKTSVPVEVPDPQWKYLQRVRNWSLTDSNGRHVPVKVLKLGNQKSLEIDLEKVDIAPDAYRLSGYWDWTPFQAAGEVHVRPLSDFKDAKLEARSQDLLIAKSGKMPVTLAGSDFEFTEKVEFKKAGDEFATAEPLRFILPKGLREGPQTRMDVQIDTANLDPGRYQLLVHQQGGKSHTVYFQVLPELPVIENLPILVNQGAAQQHYELKGQRLSLLSKLEAPEATLSLGPEGRKSTERNVIVQLKSTAQPGTSFPLQAYLRDRTAPVTLPDALQITGPLPVIASSKLSIPTGMEISLLPNEFPAGYTLAGMLDVKNIGPKSVLNLACAGGVGSHATLHIGEQTPSSSLQQLFQDELYLMFDTGPLPAGCSLEAVLDSGREGRSQPFTLARIVRLPYIDSFDTLAGAPRDGGKPYTLSGHNLEMLGKIGWDEANGVEITSLPAPIPGQGQKETLGINLPAPPAPKAMLLVWLRGEDKPRATSITAPPTAIPAMPPPPALSQPSPVAIPPPG
jgi:hypothetical protein